MLASNNFPCINARNCVRFKLPYCSSYTWRGRLPLTQALLFEPLGPLRIPLSRNACARQDKTQGEGGYCSPVTLSLVVPTYNERQNLEGMIHSLSWILDRHIPNDYELIVVDDNSPDQTWRLAQALTSRYAQLRVMRRQGPRGLSTAVIRGWQVARGEVLGVIDADLQHPPEVMTQLLIEIDQGADLAVASRHIQGGGVREWSMARRFLSWGARMLGLVVLPKVLGRVSDPLSGYFLVRRSAIAGASLDPMGYKILLEILGRGRVEQVEEVGYMFQGRQVGASKVTWKQYVQYLIHLLRLRQHSSIHDSFC